MSRSAAKANGCEVSSSPTSTVKPEIIEWACARSGKPRDELQAGFPGLDDWVRGAASPTLDDLQGLADATYTGFGDFFGTEPPCDELPIPDLRSCRDDNVRPPSPHLLQTVYDCQFRQDVYSEYIVAEGGRMSDFSSAAEVGDGVHGVARKFAGIAGFDLALRHDADDAGSDLQKVADAMRDAGVLVFFGGIAGADAARPLDPEEFHGFALADSIAPAIFVNSRCSGAEQMVMLAHGFAHVIAGESGVSDASSFGGDAGRIERWWAELASALLAPLDDLREQVGGSAARDVDYALGEDRYLQAPSGAECADALARVGRRYARVVVHGIRTGTATYTDIDYLLGIRSLELFEQIASEVGLAR